MSGTQTQQSRKRAVNFSRPRVDTGESEGTKLGVIKEEATPRSSFTQQDNDSQVTVKAINAFHEKAIEPPSPSLPDEPRFSLDDPSTEKIPVESDRNTPSDLVWDDRRGELVPRIPSAQLNTSDERYPGPARKDSEASTSTNSGSSTSRPNTGSSTSTNRPDTGTARPLKSILKHTSVTQTSERASSSDAGESTGSHHTVSESGSSLVGKDGKWTSSDHDTSMLSEKEIKKLEKKGINPALYVEMKNAKKKGGSCVGSLAGNAYVS